ncbi:hypothetical protein AA11825_0957 [Acetobacter pomorum DSM 11825]|nr:hypothetical protein AA11825_0957 [Acetobacter pomorum DSM 11825]
MNLDTPYAWTPTKEYGLDYKVTSGLVSPSKAALMSVRVPNSDFGWRYHPNLGFAVYRGE